MKSKYFIVQSRFHSDEHIQSEWVSHAGSTTLDEAKRHVEFMKRDRYPWVDYRIVDPAGKEIHV